MSGLTHLPGWLVSFVRVIGSTVVGKDSAVLVGGDGAVGGLDESDAEEDGEKITDAEFYGALGIVARPPKGDDTDAAEAIAVRTGAGLVPVAWRDMRLFRLFPNGLKDGEVALVGYGGSFVKHDKNGTVSTVTTTDGTPNGKTVYSQVRRDGFVTLGPWGKQTFDQKGFHLLHYSGARIDLGGIGGLPSPLDTLGSYVSLSAAMAKIKASVITLGPDGAAADPAAKATPTLAMLGTIVAALEALTLAVDAIVVVPPIDVNPAAVAAAGVASTAVGVAVGAAVTAAAAIPSASVSVT